jgi:hypothetical protein
MTEENKAGEGLTGEQAAFNAFMADWIFAAKPGTVGHLHQQHIWEKAWQASGADGLEAALRKIVDKGDFTAPEGMKHVARAALASRSTQAAQLSALRESHAELLVALTYARRFLKAPDHDIAYVSGVLSRAKELS